MSEKKKNTGPEAVSASEETVFEPASADSVPEASLETNSEAAAADSDDTGLASEADLKVKLTEQHEQYLRLMAEFDNFRRRTAREYAERQETANEKIMLEMVEVRDNFERALKAAQQNADPAVLIEGMRLIFDKFDAVLTKNGLAPYGDAGDKFTPELHSALMNVPHEEIAEGHIADIFEKGYRLKNKVIKHGRVVVSSGRPGAPKKAAAPDAENAKNQPDTAGAA